jgi:hypothetical protein
MTTGPDNTRRQKLGLAAIAGLVSGLVRAAVDAILEHVN